MYGVQFPALLRALAVDQQLNAYCLEHWGRLPMIVRGDPDAPAVASEYPAVALSYAGCDASGNELSTFWELGCAVEENTPPQETETVLVNGESHVVAWEPPAGRAAEAGLRERAVQAFVRAAQGGVLLIGEQIVDTTVPGGMLAGGIAYLEIRQPQTTRQGRIAR